MLDPAALAAAPPAPRGPNILKLLVQIWVLPRRALIAVADGPAGLWLVPFILALALTVGRSFAAAPGLAAEQRAKNEAMIAARIAGVPEEFRETIPEEYTTVPEPTQVLTLWVPMGLAAAGVVFGWLVRAAVLHVGSLALGGRQSFGRIYRTAAWASFPLLLRDAVQAVYLAATGEAIRGAGLSGLLNTGQGGEAAAMVNAVAPGKVGAVSAVSSAGPVAGPAAAAAAGSTPGIPGLLLARIDLFALWYFGLVVVAVVAAGKLSRGKALAVALIYAVLSLLTALGPLVTRGITGGG